MPISEMIPTLIESALSASSGALVVVPLIFTYFTWMSVMAAYRIRQNIKEDQHNSH